MPTGMKLDETGGMQHSQDFAGGFAFNYEFILS